MQGVRIVACALLATLAVPAVLLANEEPAPPPPAHPTGIHTEDQLEPPILPTGEDEAVAPSEKPAGKDASGSPSPTPGPAAPESSAGSDEPKGDAKRSGQAKHRRGGDGRAGVASVRTVIMRNIKFHPRDLTIDVGDTVRWENRDEEPHNATGRNGSFQTETFTKGGSASHTFNRAGKFPYVCTIHQGMNATITVAGSGSGSPNGGGTDSGGGTGSDDSGSDETSSGSAGGISSLGGSSGTESLSGGGGTSSLPSTGQDLVWLVLAGAGLLTLGAAMRLLVGRRA